MNIDKIDNLHEDEKSITRSSEDVDRLLQSRQIEQNYKDLAELSESISDILPSQDKDDPYATDIEEQSKGIKSLIKLEDIFITTDKMTPIDESADIVNKIFDEKSNTDESIVAKDE